ncbi:hypothetical protein WJU23_21835 [Prosthecobacter sp. SYSU 5D2]|uniref:hypothetical protein n=1 Tax=Prosthecobacter sp. SYSU 5D2 TaxID=3134134 RepID=UPI0031FF00D0
MTPPPLPSKDRSHLRTLVICHYVAAGLSVFGLAFLGLHYAFVKHFFANPKLWEKAKEQPPFDPAEFFGFIQWFYLAMGLIMVAGGVLTVISSRCIQRRVSRTFSIVVAALNCLQFPLGTLLGVFTLIVLSRDSVAQLYLTEGKAKEEG